MKRTVGLLLVLTMLLSMMTGCRSSSSGAAEALRSACRYQMTTHELETALTPTALSFLLGDQLFFLASAQLPGAEADDTSPASLENRLYRVDLKTGALALVKAYPGQQEQAAEAYSRVEALFSGEAEELWVLESTTHYIFDYPKNFDEKIHDKWDYYQYRGNSATLCSYASDGTELARLQLTNLPEAVMGAAISGGRIFCAMSSQLLVLDADGTRQSTVSVPGWITAAVRLSDGYIAVLCEEEREGACLYRLHPQTLELSAKEPLPTPLYNICGTSRNKLCFTDRGNLFAWDLEKQTGEKLLDWMDLKIHRSGIAALRCAEDGSIAAIYQESPGSALRLLILRATSLPAPTAALTMGMPYPNEMCLSLVLEFNRRREGGDIRIADYSEYANLAMDGAAQLQNDLTAGAGLDLLFSPDPESSVITLAKPLLADLAPRMADDEALQKQQLMNSVLALLQADGRQLAISPSFLLHAGIGRSDVLLPLPLNVARVNTLSQYLENDGLSPMPPYVQQSDALYDHMCRNSAAYLSPDGPDSELLRCGLALAALYPEALDRIAYESRNLAPEWVRVREKNQVYLSGCYGSFHALAQDMNAIGDSAVLFSLPDSGYAAELCETYGMLSACKEPDLAWIFLRRVLLENVQSAHAITGFPTNRSAFLRLGRSAQQGGSISYYPMQDAVVEISGQLTPQQLTMAEQAADSIVQEYRRVPYALAEAVYHAAYDYLRGDGTIDNAVLSAKIAVLLYHDPEQRLMPEK